MYNFAYHRPRTIDQAVSLLDKDEEGKFLAGGQTLIPTLKHRLANPSILIDLGGIDALRGIDVQQEYVRIRAMVTHAQVASSQMVQQLIPALSSLAGGIGDVQVRNCGTLGGSICNNDPAADYPAAILGLDAIVETTERKIPAAEFFTGMFETALARKEIVLSVHFPKPDAATYIKFSHPASRYAIVGVFVARFGRVTRVAVTGAQECVFQLSTMEAALNTNFTVSSLDEIEIDSVNMLSDLSASRDYRAHLVMVMAKRAVAAVMSNNLQKS